jgi:hypothetical protein
MTAGGLGHTDLGLAGKELGGITREFYERVSTYYTTGELHRPSSRVPATTNHNTSSAAHTTRTPSNGTAQATQCYLVESHVAQAVYTAMLQEAGVIVRLGQRVVTVLKRNTSITTLSTISTTDPPIYANVTAAVYIDATYEGDLMALAGVSYTVGRESTAQYGEESAGRMAPNDVLSRYQFHVAVNSTDSAGHLLPLVYGGDVVPVGKADAKVQAYCYRPCMTKMAGGRGVHPSLFVLMSAVFTPCIM